MSFTVSWSLLKLMSIWSAMPSSHHILWHPLFLLPSIFCSIRVFSNEPTLVIRWPKYRRLNFSIVLPMNIKDCVSLGLTGLISLQSKGLSRVFSNTTIQNISSLVPRILHGPTLTFINDYWKNHSFDYMDLC